MNQLLTPKMVEIYKKYIKSKSCIICGRMGVDPHHVETLGMGGKNKTGEKDYSCIPLCREHHSELDAIGIDRFVEKYGGRLEPISKNILLGHAFKYFSDFILID